MKLNRSVKFFSPSRVIIFGFLVLILVGTLFLMLPFSSADGKGISFIDSLFTATSGSCVTGLVVKDTGTYWSYFGQAVIILLIQIGGMGIVTMALAFSLISGKKIGIMQRRTMQEAISADKIGGIIRLTGFILMTMFLIELIGAILMMPVFCKDYGIGKGIWFSVFHSISAFCNAGFDLLGVKEPFSSLVSYQANAIINITVMLLIIIGGLGFLTWDDIRTYKFKLRRYRMQSKVILAMTAGFILLATAYFFFFEFSDYPLKSRLLLSLFQSVTPRTAGFNTIDASKISQTGNGIVTILMLVGGAPGSTAGGMKITTVAVIAATAISSFRKKSDAVMFRRRISAAAIKNAATIFIMYIVFFSVGAFLISRIENLPLLSSLYETASAIGTVGLTTGITPSLGTTSKLILIFLMYTGRVGGMTLIFAALPTNQNNIAKLPQENITVG